LPGGADIEGLEGAFDVNDAVFKTNVPSHEQNVRFVNVVADNVALGGVVGSTLALPRHLYIGCFLHLAVYRCSAQAEQRMPRRSHSPKGSRLHCFLDSYLKTTYISVVLVE
jgi:hypothetical protein